MRKHALEFIRPLVLTALHPSIVICLKASTSLLAYTEDPTATQENAGSTQESTQETSKSTQEMILDEIRKHPFTTREQLAKVIGITPDGIKKQLDKMKKANRIKHVGPTKGGHWEIITE